MALRSAAFRSIPASLFPVSRAPHRVQMATMASILHRSNPRKINVPPVG